jgi:Protein of unknown function (DUF3892)
MTLYQIHCVCRGTGLDPHERIEFIGIQLADGTVRKMSQQEAVTNIRNSIAHFFIMVDGKPISVIRTMDESGREYLKSFRDGEQPNDLLDLSGCP